MLLEILRFGDYLRYVGFCDSTAIDSNPRWAGCPMADNLCRAVGAINNGACCHVINLDLSSWEHFDFGLANDSGRNWSNTLSYNSRWNVS